MNKTAIEWCDFSANPLKYRDAAGHVVWACIHASEGCRNCYSEALAKRYGRGGPFTALVMKGLTPFLDDAELCSMSRAQRIGGKAVNGSRCFVGDMTDLFGEWVPDDLLNRLFSEVLERRQDVTWQLLTKRADRLREYLSWRWGGGRIPSRNIHVGVSVENRDALWRINRLKDTPAAIRWVSFEPLLENLGALLLDGIHWAVWGGESGPKARPCNVAWIRSGVQQCRANGVVPFVKQLGSHVRWNGNAPAGGWWPDHVHAEEVGGDSMHGAFRMRLRESKGGAIEEFPADLRVREFPA